MVAVRHAMPRTRKAIAILCVGLVVFAAFVPAVAANVVVEVLTPLWLVVPAVAVTIIRRRALLCDVQPASLLSLDLLRAPPRVALT
jgi:hypothetical protein